MDVTITMPDNIAYNMWNIFTRMALETRNYQEQGRMRRYADIFEKALEERDCKVLQEFEALPKKEKIGKFPILFTTDGSNI